MLKLASASASVGGQVVLASSNDDRNPPENIVDGNPDTFWVTTGLFPQEVVLTYPSPVTISSVLIRTSNVRRVCVKSSNNSEPKEFEKQAEKELESQDGRLQSEELKFDKPVSARHLKLVILQGFEHFVSVYSIGSSGTPVQ